MLQTQVTLLSVEDSVANAQAAMGIAHVRLYKALGGGWQPESAARPSAGGPRLGLRLAGHIGESTLHERTRRISRNERNGRRRRGDRRDGTLDDIAPAPVWRRPSVWIAVALVAILAAGAFVWRSRQQAAAAPSLRDRSRHARRSEHRGDRQRHAATDAHRQYRQRALGHRDARPRRRQRPDQEGQVLVELDTAKFGDQVARSRATVASATAKVAQTVATVKEVGEPIWRDCRKSRAFPAARCRRRRSSMRRRHRFERAQADEAAARASVVDAKAALSTDETNLSKASIKSPIDGIVLTRTVDPGNAVAASLQAVTLFTIAEDLTKMKLQVNVDEADVGMVDVGQNASFTVSAYPARKYPAKITRVAYGSTITDNVVTYITYLEVENTDLSLRPGMTATATISATERRDVLLVPNTALRFTPDVAGRGRRHGGGDKGGGIVSSLMPRGPARAPKAATAATGSAAARRVWVLRDGQPVAIAIKPGVSDGRMTEVTSAELQPGMQVITDQRAAAGS